MYSENSHGIDDSRISGTIYTVVHKDQYRVEVSFYRPYDPSTGAGIPLNIDKRWVHNLAIVSYVLGLTACLWKLLVTWLESQLQLHLIRKKMSFIVLSLQPIKIFQDLWSSSNNN